MAASNQTCRCGKGRVYFITPWPPPEKPCGLIKKESREKEAEKERLEREEENRKSGAPQARRAGCFQEKTVASQ